MIDCCCMWSCKEIAKACCKEFFWIKIWTSIQPSIMPYLFQILIFGKLTVSQECNWCLSLQFSKYSSGESIMALQFSKFLFFWKNLLSQGKVWKLTSIGTWKINHDYVGIIWINEWDFVYWTIVVMVLYPLWNLRSLLFGIDFANTKSKTTT